MTRDTLIKGGIGSSATFGSIGISFTEVDHAMQILSLAVGIAVGIASFISIVKPKKTNHKKHKHHEH